MSNLYRLQVQPGAAGIPWTYDFREPDDRSAIAWVARALDGNQVERAMSYILWEMAAPQGRFVARFRHAAPTVMVAGEEGPWLPSTS